MEKKELMKQFWAGIFFLAGIVLIFVFIMTIGRDKGLSESKFHVQVFFSNVGGLMEGAPVRLLGVNVGTVDHIGFLEKEVDGRRVEVVLNIYSKFRRQVAGGMRFTIKTEGVLGEKLVEIYALENGPAVDLGKPVLGENPLDIQDLAQVFAEAAESFTKTADELSQIDMVEMAHLMSESSRALLLTAEGINAIMGELQEITKKSKRLIDRLEQRVIDGTLLKVF